MIPLGIARHYIPLFGVFRFCIAAFAVFERNWLFKANHEPEKAAAVPTAPIIMAATAEDFAAWQQYLSQKKSHSYAPGTSLKTEYEQWLMARQQSQASQAAGKG